MPAPVINQNRLTPEQERFVDSWAWGPFLSSSYFLAMGMSDQAIHQLVLTYWGANWPWTRMRSGRRLVWERRAWSSFEEFQQAQIYWDQEGKHVAIMTAVGVISGLVILAIVVSYSFMHTKQ